MVRLKCLKYFAQIHVGSEFSEKFLDFFNNFINQDETYRKLKDELGGGNNRA